MTSQAVTTFSSPRSVTIVVANGSRPLPKSLPPGRLIAADGGLMRCLNAGRTPDVVIGDLDSTDNEVLEDFVFNGGMVEQHPTDKNATDLELALDLVAPGSELIVVGGDGDDRFDHLLGELSHLAQRAHQFTNMTVHYPPARIHVVHSGSVLSVDGLVGQVVSLVPLGPCIGISTKGLRWVLNHEDLPPGTTRGVSNEFAMTTATIALGQGTLLVVLPGGSQ